VNIRPITTIEEFFALRSSWDELLAAMDDASIFMSWEWNYNWWKHYGKGRSLNIATAWDGDRLVGILPVYIEHRRIFRFYHFGVLRFIGTGGDTTPDDLGALLDPRISRETALALTQHLFDDVKGWHVLLLSDLQAEAPLYRTLAAESSGRGYPHLTKPAARIAYVELPATWDDYLASLNRDRRYAIRRARRILETEHQARFSAIEGEQETLAALDHLISLHHKRWRGHPDGHAFATPEYNDFHREVIRDCSRRGWIRFYCLEAGDEPVAMLYCYHFRNHVFFFQTGFDPKFERLSPGQVLIGHAIEHAILAGHCVFDFLRGEHGYKTHWAKSVRETLTLTAYRPGLSSLLIRLRWEQLPRWRRRLESILRPSEPASPRHEQKHQHV
jgi:CelD/BcsL family acetyltransferase involved in cellulose biosynthesis